MHRRNNRTVNLSAQHALELKVIFLRFTEVWNVGKITSFGFHAKIRCNLNDISYLSKTQKNNFQFLLQLLIYSFLFSIYNYVFLKKHFFS